MVLELNTKRERNQKPTKYWLVTLTLTSGKNVEFYVKARNIYDAYEKADEYVCYADVENLVNEFKLIH